ncbi:hypothetical protein [Paenibacillus amylolyticus]|uniref:hypothetical protein n=1 Tax=Paenibacillus amylolyticus TaxID=1451 RepID=UPI00096C051C|nr:hypothetical protein [Paenibacillus amylolyticus]OME97557.1 hypothetical protein BK124_16325 [Paenibacillus amylolyticus]OMF44495.1 hypothetical protein BK136_11600 [Paenibacillus amylolyticus]
MNEVQERFVPAITLLRGENLQYLFTTLFIFGFIAFLGFVVGMILSIRKGNRLPIRFIFLTTACFAIASIGLYGMLTLSSNSTQSEIDQTPSSQIKLSGLHMTTEEFKNKFNGAVGKYRLNGLSITRLNIQDSSEQGTDTFEYVFNDELRLVGAVNADESIQEVRLYATGDTSEPTGGIFLTAIATLILTTNSEYTYNDAQDVIQDIGLLGRDVNQSDFNGATVRNGLEYRFSVQDSEHSTFEITVAR